MTAASLDVLQCAHYDAARCRSCTWLPQPYRQQLAAKDADLRARLAACESVGWLPPVPSPLAGFRNKAKMVVSGTAEQPVLGLVHPDGTSVDLRDCALYPPALRAAFDPVLEFVRAARIAPYSIAGRRGELKYVLVTVAEHSSALMIRFVLRSQEALGRMRRALPALQAALPALVVASVNLQPEHKAIVEGEHEILLTAADALTMQVDGLPLHLKPRSFFQTNTAVAAALYRQARDWVAERDPRSVWDLFCGVGGFALHVADGRRDVIGIEASEEAIDSARRSAAEAGIERVQFRALDAAAFAAGASGPAPDLVIVNPPRRGIGMDLCRWLDASSVRWIVYSSCNADTLARDIAAMPAFAAQQARLLDMFPHTAHYEAMVLLERRA